MHTVTFSCTDVQMRLLGNDHPEMLSGNHFTVTIGLSILIVKCQEAIAEYCGGLVL